MSFMLHMTKIMKTYIAFFLEYPRVTKKLLCILFIFKKFHAFHAWRNRIFFVYNVIMKSLLMSIIQEFFSSFTKLTKISFWPSMLLFSLLLLLFTPSIFLRIKQLSYTWLKMKVKIYLFTFFRMHNFLSNVGAGWEKVNIFFKVFVKVC